MLKKLLLLLVLPMSVCAQDLPLIPQPQELKLLRGEKEVNFEPASLFSDPEGLAAFFKNGASPVYSLGNPGSIEITKSDKIKKEAYQLKVLPDGPIQIKASDAAGAFYGLQTLYQLTATGNSSKIPHVEISDAPKFPWRGMHLDVCRHFFSD